MLELLVVPTIVFEPALGILEHARMGENRPEDGRVLDRWKGRERIDRQLIDGQEQRTGCRGVFESLGR